MPQQLAARSFWVCLWGAFWKGRSAFALVEGVGRISPHQGGWAPSDPLRARREQKSEQWQIHALLRQRHPRFRFLGLWTWTERQRGISWLCSLRITGPGTSLQEHRASSHNGSLSLPMHISVSKYMHVCVCLPLVFFLRRTLTQCVRKISHKN